MRSLNYLVVLICVFIVSCSCYGEGFYGQVCDNETGLSIESAVVTIRLDGSEKSVEKLTDENGIFGFLPNELPWSAYQYNTLYFTANKEEYKEYKYSLDYYDDEYLYDSNRVGYVPINMRLNKESEKHSDNSAIVIRMPSNLFDTCAVKIKLKGERKGYRTTLKDDEACKERITFCSLPPDTYHLTIKFDQGVRRETIRLKKNVTKNKVIH